MLLLGWWCFVFGVERHCWRLECGCMKGAEMVMNKKEKRKMHDVSIYHLNSVIT